MRSITPFVFLSLNACCKPALIFSALLTLSGEMTPRRSTSAVCLPEMEISLSGNQPNQKKKNRDKYIKVSDLKNMPQRRARRCSCKEESASFSRCSFPSFRRDFLNQPYQSFN